jgi:predicted phosphodiesterase
MIYFLGDVHGRFDHILRAIQADESQEGKPKAAVFLGDIEPLRRFEHEIQPLLDAGIEVWFIHGNHDTDIQPTWDNLLGSGDRNLHGRVVAIQGLRVGGLGGIFRGEIWYPKDAVDAGVAKYRSYADYERQIRQEPGLKRRLSKMDLVQLQAVPSRASEAELLDQSRTGKLLKHSSTIFPEVVESLAAQRADILVTHEAPSCHPHGFQAIDRLARAMGVEAVFHGHHHDNLDYWPWDKKLGFRAYGVGFRGITSETGAVITPGDRDEARRYRQTHPEEEA